MGSNNKNSAIHRQGGFSLLELLGSMVIFMVVTGSVWGLLRAAQMSRSTINEQVQLSKNVRVALNLMSRDTLNAGYGYPLRDTVLLPDNRISTRIGIPNDSDSSRDTVPPIISGNNITLNTFNTAANIRTDQVTFLSKDPSFNDATGVSQALIISASATLTGGVVELSSATGNASCRINDIYILTAATNPIRGGNGSTLAVATGVSGATAVQFANGDSLGFNETAANGLLNNISATALYRVKMITYFVTADGILTRREFANITPTVPFIDEPLVYNVENFQIQYVMDDGTLSDNPSAGPDGIAGTPDDTQSNLAAVRQVRFSVSVRSVEKSTTGQVYKETMTTTVSTRNLGYEAN